MTRPWGKQYAHMLNHPKYLRATVEERSAWHSLFLVALNSPREDMLGTRDEVIAILGNLGHGAAAGDRLDSLVRLKLVDVRRGQFRIHDWSEYQPDDPTGAKRKAAERAKSNGKRPRTVTRHSADSPQTVNGTSSAGHALDGDSEEIPPPTPSQARGRSRRRPNAKDARFAQYDATAQQDDNTADWLGGER